MMEGKYKNCQKNVWPIYTLENPTFFPLYSTGGLNFLDSRSFFSTFDQTKLNRDIIKYVLFSK